MSYKITKGICQKCFGDEKEFAPICDCVDITSALRQLIADSDEDEVLECLRYIIEKDRTWDIGEFTMDQMRNILKMTSAGMKH